MKREMMQMIKLNNKVMNITTPSELDLFEMIAQPTGDKLELFQPFNDKV